MKIIIISQYNIFSFIGGTESYVDMLIKGLVEKGKEVVLITKGNQKNNTKTEFFFHREIQYKVIFLPAVNFTRAEIEQKVVSSTWQEMLPILKSEMPDIIHVHTYTTFFNIRHFEKCRELFDNIFYTAHIPADFCPKGDLIQFMKKPCDGLLYSRCSFCLFSKNFKDGISNLFHSYWKKVLQRLEKLNSLGIRLICVSDWQKQQAAGNGFNSNHIYVIRQAIITQNYTPFQSDYSNREFTIGYLGRLAPEKGASLLLEVISALLAKSNFRFVLGIPIENCTPEYVSLLQKLSGQANGRITILDNIDASNKDVFFKETDCLFIPSFFLETGPIVLLEALIFNKQVVAPDVGGPLEYKNEFNNSITLYKWNHLPSAIESLELVSKKQQIGFDNYTILKEKEKLFIKMHEDIYNEAIYKQKAVHSL